MVKIAEINAQNPWWSQGAEFVRYDQTLQRAEPIFFERKPIEFKQGHIYILRGPRQVGKTTFLKESISKLITSGMHARDILYLSVDFFTSRRELRNAIHYFLDTRREAPHVYIFLDEITFLEDWNIELKYLADQGVLRKGSVVATSSSAVKLKEKGELLPGRGIEGNEYYIKPLSFRQMALQSIDFITKHITEKELVKTLENLHSALSRTTVYLKSDFRTILSSAESILPFKKEIDYLFRLYLICGGFPGVINHYFSNRFANQQDVIEPTVAEIYIRDVFGDLSRLQKQETIIRQILKAIIERTGSRYSFSKLSREVDRTHVTIIDYLEFMEDSFICFLQYAFDFNKKYAKTKGDKKVYFFDPFILYAMKGYLEGSPVWKIITDAMEDEDSLAKIVEGMTLAHLRMHDEIPLLRTANTFLWFYYDKNGREIDAIFKIDGQYLALEVKYQTQVHAKDVKQIAPVKKYVLLSKDEVGGTDATTIFPVNVFLALLPVSKNNI